MERGDGGNPFHKMEKSNPGSSIFQHGDLSNLNSSNVRKDNSNITRPVMREQDRFMPVANVTCIMRNMLPPYVKIFDDAKEAIQECVSEFISFITGEANEHCQLEQRKTVTAEDLLCAMGKLGFDNYVELLTIFLNRYREAKNNRTSLHGELILKRGIDHGTMMMPPLNNPDFQARFRQGFPDAATTANANAIAGGYNQEASGAATGTGSSSQAATNNSDPFGRFK